MTDDKTLIGVQKSAQLGENIEAFMDSGLSFLQALDAYLKVYEHPEKNDD